MDIRSKLRRMMVLACIPMLWLSCGQGRDQHDPTARYTTEGLAQELAFRYKALPQNARKVSSGPSKKAAPLKEQDLKKSGEATKAEQVDNADALFNELATKVRSLEGMTPADAFKKVSDAIQRDSSLEPSEKEILTKRLGELARES